MSASTPRDPPAAGDGTSVAAGARVLSELPGRLRVHLPAWQSAEERAVEEALCSIPGVRGASANRMTRNALIDYDARRLDPDSLKARAEALGPREHEARPPPAGAAHPRRLEAERPSGERDHPLARVRVAVRGLDRDSELAQRLIGSLRRRPGVERVSASRLTGRVLIEFDAHRVAVEDLVGHITGMELPELPGEDLPAHPLDPTPLIQSAARSTGAALGLGVLAARRLAGITDPPSGAAAPAAIAAAAGIVEGMPPLRSALRRLLGTDGAQLASGAVQVVSLTFAGGPLGLAVVGAAALRMLSEVRARRRAWRAYEQRLAGAAEALPGERVRIGPGQRCPLAGTVLEGSGTMVSRDALARAICPGDTVTAGARLWGGPFVVDLLPDRAFEPPERPVPAPRTRLDRYLAALSPAALAYAALTAVLTRSPSRAMTALLLVNARPAVIGAEAADSAASARMLRSGVTVVSTRGGRALAMPQVLLIDGARVLSDRRLEVSSVISTRAEMAEADILSMASGMAAAADSPWGPAFPQAGRTQVSEAAFEDGVVRARVGRSQLRLGPPAPSGAAAEWESLEQRGNQVLALSGEDGRVLGLIALRARLAPGAARLVEACRSRQIAVEVLDGDDSPACRRLAGEAGVEIVPAGASQRVHQHQSEGRIVALLADSPHAASALMAADVAIAFTSGTSGAFAAPADLLAPDLDSVAAIVQSAARRRAAIDDAVAISTVSNVAGAVVGLRSELDIRRGSRASYIGALAAIALGGARLAGGRPSRTAARRFADPDPERWARPELPELLRRLGSNAGGLSQEEAARRLRARPQPPHRHPLAAALDDQLRSPVTGALGVGAAVSLAFGAVGDVALIFTVLAVNAAVGVWQENQADRAAALLAREASGPVTVRRDGQLVSVPAHEVVAGDVIVLGSGDRVPADARLLESETLEADESSLTGESLPVAKAVDDPSEGGRILLEGSDITVGSAVAVVFAVGEATRMGATTAALAAVEPRHGALEARLNRIIRQGMPIVGAGAGLVALAGLLWRRPLGPQLAIAATVATAAVPEGLPLLSGVAEAAVARRLAGRKALVRRLSSVEALGRVDVACADKTGTLTAGRLALTAVEPVDGERAGARNGRARREVLLDAALACPHPDAHDAGAHPTDLAVVAGAEQDGMEREIRAARRVEIPFDPARAFHATVAGERLLVKGATEALIERCRWRRSGERRRELDERSRAGLVEQGEALARRGLRVLMVAEAPAPAPQEAAQRAAEDPQGLTAVGFVGISDPLREGVQGAIARCSAAGVRVIMLTGDHPATARAVAQEAGLEMSNGGVLTGREIAELDDGDLDERLAQTSVVARITPLDKLRIVERLQSAGHTVAMTGDGVNDAPALRLADVGVAMGRHGTEVARQASDVVLADDEFATLVETLVEGRSFWRNLRRSLGLLLGGNLGELGLMAAASVLGLRAPLNTRQILTVNLVTDVLPALAVAAQQPEHRDLSTLRLEGGREIERRLRSDVIRRGIATAGPSVVAYALASRLGGAEQARSVAFGSIVATQLAQAVSLGRAEGSLTRPVVGAIAASGGVAGAAMALPALSGFLGLAMPTPPALALIALAVAASLALASRRGSANPLQELAAMLRTSVVATR